MKIKWVCGFIDSPVLKHTKKTMFKWKKKSLCIESWLADRCHRAIPDNVCGPCSGVNHHCMHQRKRIDIFWMIAIHFNANIARFFVIDIEFYRINNINENEIKIHVKLKHSKITTKEEWNRQRTLPIDGNRMACRLTHTNLTQTHTHAQSTFIFFIASFQWSHMHDPH